MGKNYHKRPFFVLAAFEVFLVGAILHVVVGAQAADFYASIVQILQISAANLIFIGSIFVVGLYDWRYASNMAEVLARLAAAFFLAIFGYAILSPAIGLSDLGLIRFAATALACFVTLTAVRAVFIKVCSSERLKARVMILGVGERAKRLQDVAARMVHSRFRIAAFVNCENAMPVVDTALVCAPPNSLLREVWSREIDEIVIALDDRRGQLPLDDLVECRLAGIQISDYQTFCERSLRLVDINALSPSWFLYSDGFRRGRIDQALKRAFDFVVSLVMLMITSPIMALAALAIKLESRGPVFYKQERVGLGGKPFTVIKFRSMRTDAEASGTPKWAQKNDPRVTRVGSFIRKTRIDEIPQLINVLKGEMSVVGPRPERAYFVDNLSKDIRFYRQRHAAKPGITGWAQLNFPYGASLEDAKNKLEYDLFYIKHFNIIFDFLILIQTVRVVLWAEGAR